MSSSGVQRGEGGEGGEDKNERLEGTEGGGGGERTKIRRLENEMKIKDILGGEKTPAM